MDTHDRYRIYVENLQLLNRVLANSQIAGRYAVFGGLLLGIIRDGQPLPNDWDADFYCLDTDDERFLQSIPQLLESDFRKLYRFVANDGRAWEHSFVKDDAKFEFYRTSLGEAKQLYYHNFVPGREIQQPKAFIGLPIVPMKFLGCTWMVTKDVDAGLTSVYGDWHRRSKLELGERPVDNFARTLGKP